MHLRGILPSNTDSGKRSPPRKRGIYLALSPNHLTGPHLTGFKSGARNTCTCFAPKNGWGNYRKHVRPNQDIPEPLKPVDGDLVITTGDMMHRLLAERGIRVLFYCGFATNMCLIDKPGAIADMAARGYMPIVIRDASTGTENSETVDGLWITHAFIDQIEMMWGYSITTQEFLSAMRNTEKIEVPCRYLRMHKPMESETGQSRSSGNSM